MTHEQELKHALQSVATHALALVDNPRLLDEPLVAATSRALFAAAVGLTGSTSLTRDTDERPVA